jgi:hypothetical protein
MSSYLRIYITEKPIPNIYKHIAKIGQFPFILPISKTI